VDPKLERARAAKARVIKLLSKSRSATVSGVGITEVDGDYAVKVNLAEPPGRGFTLPDTIDGVRIVIEVVGTIAKRI